jgi:N-acetylglucosaminyldiphosphoundecaprenol N-acetyl-beta-D-mannosaminyltransferase
LIIQALEKRQKGYICITGVHGVSEAQGDPDLRRILNRAFLCTPDGMPMVWMGRWRGHREMARVYGPDLMLEIMAWSQTQPCRHFFCGGPPGLAEALQGSMEERFPGVQISGCYSPPFGPPGAADEAELRRRVAEARPDIVWVGLSTPKQEKFMARYLPELETTLMVGVGAAFDFHCGRVRQAPRWMQRCGLEWLFRMCMEPRRLAGRYLKNNPLFLCRAALQLTGLRRYDAEIRNPKLEIRNKNQ